MKELLLQNIAKANEIYEDIADNICKYIKGETTSISDVFATPVIGCGPSKIFHLRGKKGLYIFIVKEDHSFTSEQLSQWNNIKPSGAGFIDISQNKHRTINKGECLYLGSATKKSLLSRLNEHYGLANKDSANALKLNHKNRQLFPEGLDWYAFPIDKAFEPYYKEILTSIESILHNKLNPHCGSKRT